jgi:hypothetical protein
LGRLATSEIRRSIRWSAQPRPRTCCWSDQSIAAQAGAEDAGRDLARINEITFNSSLMSELRGISFVGKLIDEGKLPRGNRCRAIPED